MSYAFPARALRQLFPRTMPTPFPLPNFCSPPNGYPTVLDSVLFEPRCLLSRWVCSGTSRPGRGLVPLDVLDGRDRAGHAHIPAILAEDRRITEIVVCIVLSEYSLHIEDICKD